MNMPLYLIPQMIVSLALLSCFQEHKVNDLIFRVGLRPYKNIILYENEVFLVGIDRADPYDLRTVKSVVLHKYLHDQNAKMNLINGPLNGGNESFFKTENSIYLLNTLYEGKHKVTGPTQLYKLNKTKKKWSELYVFNQFNVKSIHFEENDSVGYAFVGTSNYAKDKSLLITTDGGYNWKDFVFDRPVVKTFHKDDLLYFLSYKPRSKIHDWIYSINIKTKIIDSTQFGINIKDFHVESNNEYWLLGEDQNSVVLQQSKDGLTRTIHVFETDEQYFAKSIYKYGDFIAVLIARIDKGLLGGLGGTVDQLYLSYDDGITWQEHKYKNALYIKALDFYKDKSFVAYIGHGNLVTSYIEDKE